MEGNRVMAASPLVDDVADGIARRVGRRACTLAVDRVEPSHQYGFEIGRNDVTRIRPSKARFGGRIDKIAGDHHHKLRLVVLEIAAAEESAQNRQILEPREAIDVLLGLLLEQAADHKRSSRRQFDRGFGATHGEGWKRQAAISTEALNLEGSVVCELAHFGRDLERDMALIENDRGEGESDAERLELDHDVAVAVARNGNREFAPDEEFRGLAGDRRQVRLGERVNEPDLLQRAHHALNIGRCGIAIRDEVEGYTFYPDRADTRAGHAGQRPTE